MVLGGLFDVQALEEEAKELDLKTKEEGFWEDVSYANKTYQQLKLVQKKLKTYYDLLDQIHIMLELVTMGEVTEKDVLTIKEEVDELEIDTLLNGEYDSSNCYLEIHPGAGGTESCDWASMLLRMYERFLEKNGFTYKVIDEQAGEEAGIKSVTLYIEGDYAYGYLKEEAGVHRLVRISPFDANKRRHTSFASVSVTPEFDTNIDLDIKDEDLKIDVYHSSGAGGQSVNTSNSAVRITHIPTKTVVTCQTERSQLRNKEIAMELLKNKLYQKELEKQESLKKSIQGDVSTIDFGSQIRSYVLEPYKLVKDHRSKYESTDPAKVLDGDLMPFIKSVLPLN